MKKTIVGVFAHPDDESISAGGTFYKAVQEGHDLYLICATRGSASTKFDRDYVKKEELSIVREKEMLRAGEVLGAKGVLFLDMIDGTLDQVEDNEGIRRLAQVLSPLEADVIVTFEPNGISLHKDHKAIHRWTMEVVKRGLLRKQPERIYWSTIDNKAGRKRQGQLMGHSSDEINTVVDIEGVQEAKGQAILQHRTQLRMLEDNKLIVDGKLQRRMTREYFIRVDENSKTLPIRENFIV